MSKIQSMKQEKRYRNETMNVLNHTNSKSNTPSLADRSLHAFKVVKQQVQSSRINRPQTSKLSTRYELSYYAGHSKEKDKILDTCDRIQKISSKSQQSRFNSRNHKTKKQNESKTKKNSYSRLYTDISALQIVKDSQRAAQQDIEKRLQTIEKIFFTNNLDSQGKSQGCSIQSPSIYEVRKNFNPLDIPINIIQMGFQSKTRIQGSKTSSQMILDLKGKFEYFNDFIEQRKCKMIYDSLDCSFTRILQKLQSSFMVIIDCMLRESDDKMKNFQYGLEQFICEQKYEMQKQSRKFQKLKQSYIDKIEGLLVKSLYVTDKINIIQERGLFNFQRAIRIIDGSEQQEPKNETLSQSVDVQDSKVGWHKQMDESQDQGYEEDAFQFQQSFRQPKDQFQYVLNHSDDNAKFKNKFYSQNSAKCLR